MKKQLILLGLTMTAVQLQADPTVDWVSDSYSSLDVILSGTGLGWEGTILSPSGLWQVDCDNYISYNPDLTYSVSVGNFGDAVYLDQLPSQYPTPTPYQPYINIGPPTYTGAAIYSGNDYVDVFQPIAPITDGNFLGESSSYLSQPVDYPYLNWLGSSTISITSIPDMNDPSTWTWTAEWKASGDSLQPTPEPSTLALAAFGGISGLMMYRRRQTIPVKVKTD